MKAIVYHRYGGPDVVSLADLPKPVPADNEVLVRIHATTVSSGDWRARSLELPAGFGVLGRLVFGLFGPRQPILGSELAGEVETVGRAVTRFKPGDQVFAYASAKMGCHAEYRTFAEDGLIAFKPENLSYQEAAALCFGGITALGFLRDKGNIKPGERVLIVGASGCVGTAAIQIARHFGAVVTGVCGTANLGLVSRLGADRVIDYTREDFTEDGETYDIILNVNGAVSYADVERLLRPGGRLLLVLGTFAQLIGLQRPSRSNGHKISAGVVAVHPADLRLLAELAATGAFQPVIDRCYRLDDAAKAHAYVDSGRKRGSVVLTTM